jgi:hypothetical protein
MKTQDFHDSTELSELEEIAHLAGTSVGNLKQVLVYRGAVSRLLAKRIADQTNGKLTPMDILYPESE